MDTIYYTLSTRRVKVCGGADLVRVVPMARPQGTPEKKAGEIVDLALGKKRLETKNAWKEFAQVTADAPDLPEEEEVAEEAPALPRTRRERGASLLELGATAAVLLAGLSSAAAFLSVL